MCCLQYAGRQGSPSPSWPPVSTGILFPHPLLSKPAILKTISRSDTLGRGEERGRVRCHLLLYRLMNKKTPTELNLTEVTTKPRYGLWDFPSSSSISSSIL